MLKERKLEREEKELKIRKDEMRRERRLRVVMEQGKVGPESEGRQGPHDVRGKSRMGPTT